MNILIIEDDIVWQTQLQLMLEELPSVQLIFAATMDEAQAKLQTQPTQFVIADIMLDEGLSFELFQAASRTYPIIFMTAHANHQFLDRSLALPQTTFLVKPFHQLTLLAAIRSLTKCPDLLSQKQNQLTVLGKFKQKIGLSYADIVYVEADGNYMKIYTTDKVYSYKSSLKELLTVLDERFLQIHKSFVINTAFVNRMDLTAGVVVVKRHELPIGRAYRRLSIARLAQRMG